MYLPIKLILIITGLQICNLVSSYAPKGHPRENKTKSVEKNLIRMLLNRYEQYGVVGRPVNDSKIKVNVLYGLQLFQILDLDENKQILRTNCWSMYTWNDSLLRWNESEYGNIKTVRIFPDQIWTPDIKLYNFADERLREHREARVVVESSGQTLWVPQALFKSTCEVEITYFPFDTQVCMLEFGSWTYDKSQMDINWWIPDRLPYKPMPYVDFSDYVPSNEWRTDGELEKNVHHENRTRQIKSVKTHRNRTHKVNGRVIVREFPVLRYRIRLHRNPSFYVFMLVIPCVLLSSLTLVVFWLPPESPAKMMLGMNIFVAFFVLLILLSESTPSAVKNFPLIGVYFCLNMIMITLSTFLATLVIHFYFRGDRNGAVPAVVRRILIDGIGRLMLVRHGIPLKKNPRKISSRLGRQRHYAPISNPNPNSLLPDHTEIVKRLSNKNQDSSVHTDGGYTRIRNASELNCMKNHLLNFCPGHKTNDNYNLFTETRRKSNLDGLPLFFDNDSILEQEVRELKRYVHNFVSRQKEQSYRSMIVMEWRALAIILDRLFSFLYIMTIAIAIMVSIPGILEYEKQLKE